MANNCWNSVQITGPKETLDIIEERFKKYNECDTFTEFGNLILGVENTDPDDENTEEMFNRIYTYNTKWWDFDIQRYDYSMNINGDSAWSPPLYLLVRITEVFDVKIEAEYEEPGVDFAGFFTAENGEYEDRQMTCFEYQLECDRHEAIDKLIEDIDNDWFDLKYAEKYKKPYLTEEEWNKVLTEITK